MWMTYHHFEIYIASEHAREEIKGDNRFSDNAKSRSRAKCPPDIQEEADRRIWEQQVCWVFVHSHMPKSPAGLKRLE